MLSAWIRRGFSKTQRHCPGVANMPSLRLFGGKRKFTPTAKPRPTPCRKIGVKDDGNKNYDLQQITNVCDKSNVDIKDVNNPDVASLLNTVISSSYDDTCKLGCVKEETPEVSSYEIDASIYAKETSADCLLHVSTQLSNADIPRTVNHGSCNEQSIVAQNFKVSECSVQEECAESGQSKETLITLLPAEVFLTEKICSSNSSEVTACNEDGESRVIPADAGGENQDVPSDSNGAANSSISHISAPLDSCREISSVETQQTYHTRSSSSMGNRKYVKKSTGKSVYSASNDKAANGSERSIKQPKKKKRSKVKNAKNANLNQNLCNIGKETGEIRMKDFIYFNPSGEGMCVETSEETYGETALPNETTPAEPARSAPREDIGPRVTMNADGELIVDQASLVVQASSCLDDLDTPGTTTQNMCVRRARQQSPRHRWSPEATRSFYTALNVYGTDLTTIGDTLGLPRWKVKLKYGAEWRRRPRLVESAQRGTMTTRDLHTEVPDHAPGGTKGRAKRKRTAPAKPKSLV